MSPMGPCNHYTASAKVILGVMILDANAVDGESSFLSEEQIAFRSSASSSTVHKMVPAFEEDGLLKVVRWQTQRDRRSRRQRFYLQWDAIFGVPEKEEGPDG